MMFSSKRTLFRFLLSAFFLGAFTLLFLPFYAEICLAAIFALAMEPVLGRYLRPRKFRWKISVAWILLAMFLVVAGPLSLVGYKLYNSIVEVSKTGFQNTEIFQKALLVKTQLVSFANNLLSRFGLDDGFDLSGMSEEGLSRVANLIMQISSGLIYKMPGFLVSLFIFCAALYFFLAESKSVREIFRRQDLLSPGEQDRFIHVLQRSCHGTVVSSVIIATLQATIVAAGGLLLDAGDFLVVWVITFFCSFIPVIGAGPVALSLGAYKAVIGQYGDAIGFVVVAVIAGTTDNLVRPYLISSNEQDLHPIVSLLAIIGALVLFGMPGLFLGPVIASVAIKIIPVLYGGERARDIDMSDPEAQKNKI